VLIAHWLSIALRHSTLFRDSSGHLKSCRGTEPTPAPPLRQTINGLFAGNGMAIDRFRTRTKEPRAPPFGDRGSLSEGCCRCSPSGLIIPRPQADKAKRRRASIIGVIRKVTEEGI